MGRIRTIKPEFSQSESMGRISREARLCFILLWTQADDEGRLRGNSRMLASLLFPYDDDAGGLMDGWLSELEGQGCIVRYLVEGSSYLQVRHWARHQKIERPTNSRLPKWIDESAEISRGLTELSPNPHRIPTELSATDLDLGPGSRTRDQDHPPTPQGAAPAAPRERAKGSGSLWPAGWDQGAEDQLQELLKGYPGKRPNGAVMSNGTPKELRDRWLAIMAANPGVTPRLLKACAWCLLEELGEDNAYLPLLTTVYGPKKATWERYRAQAERDIRDQDIRDQDAREQGEVRTPMPGPQCEALSGKAV